MQGEYRSRDLVSLILFFIIAFMVFMAIISSVAYSETAISLIPSSLMPSYSISLSSYSIPLYSYTDPLSSTNSMPLLSNDIPLSSNPIPMSSRRRALESSIPGMANENYVFERMWPVLPQPWYFNGPCGIAVDDKGFLYVADSGDNRIQKFTQEGEFVLKWGTQGSGDGQFNDPRGLAVDSSGFVYVADSFNNRIQKFTQEGEFVSKWGTQGSGDGQFNNPRGIAVNSNGFVYVADSYNRRIQKFTQEGEFVSKWGSGGGGDGQFSSPNGIAVDSNGFVYVADSGYNRIQKFTQEGEFVKKWDSRGSGDGHFYWPNGIAADSNGFVYVADSFNNRIQKFTQEGEFVSKWGSYGSGDGEFYRPYGIAVDSNGFVYVADSLNNRIQKFTQEGEFVSKWGSWGSGDGQFGSPFVGSDGPHGIALNSSGFLYVADTCNFRIQKFTQEGEFVSKWGTWGSGDGQFYESFGVAVDSNGFVYVADSFNNRIQKFTPEGEFVSKWGSYGNGNGEFYSPYGIAVDSNGFVYVADSANACIQKFTPEGEFVTKFGQFGSDPGELNRPSGIAISPDGRVYVADTDNNRIQVFTKTIPEGIQRVIIVAGGGPYPGNNLWDATQMCANFAYRALTSRGFTKDTIYYLSSNTNLDLDNNGLFDDVDSYADTNSLHHAVTQWALDPNNGPVEDVILYLVDHGEKETFRMNPSEFLFARDLSIWLNTLQERITGKVILIYDASQSGSFLPQLTSGENRVLITSASPEEPAYFIAQGSLSFSYLFWTHIFNGENVGTAFYLAKEAIGLIVEGQTPLLEDNGNLSDPYDGALAKNTYIGMHTPISDESPVIQDISPEQILEGETKAVIWAEDVSTTNPIERIFAVIIPPWHVSEWHDHVIELELLPSGGGRYEGVYEGFSSEGIYDVSVYAMDENGNISLPKKTRVYRYDDNDTRSQATFIFDTPQRHNFHDGDDEHWFMFIGIEGEIYSIVLDNVVDNCDPALEIYDTNSLDPLTSRNFGFEGEGESMNWECPHDGIYYMRVTNVIPYFSEDTGYTITVHYPEGSICTIRGEIRDAHWGFNIENIHIETSGEYSGVHGFRLSSSEGSYLFLHTRESCIVTASASGYKSKSKYITDDDFINNDSIVRDFDLEPDQNNPAIFLSPGLNLFACPFNAPQGYSSSDLAGYLVKQDGNSTVKVLRYDPPTGTYEGTTHDQSGSSSGQDFGIKNGEGYLLYMEMEKEMDRRIVLQGVQTSSLSLEAGSNIISLPCIPPGYTSYDLLLYLGPPGDIWSIRRFNTEKGAFEKTCYTFGRPSGDKYEIAKNEAYIVQMKTKKQVECPK